MCRQEFGVYIGDDGRFKVVRHQIKHRIINMVRYLSAADIYVINENIVGHRPQVRDRRLLRSAADRPLIKVFGEEQFPTIIDKAAAILHSIAYHHLFGDGNKRTAKEAVVMFFEANGYELTWDDTKAFQFILEIAQGKHEVEAVSDWLAQNVDHPDPDKN